MAKTNYQRSVSWIDQMFKRYFATKMNLVGIFELIEAKRPAMTATQARAFSKALREYKAVAFKAYPDRVKP
jgi:hypothetical protein